VVLPDPLKPSATVRADVPIDNVADRVPLAVGENVKTTVQLCPADSMAFGAQVPVRLKSPGFAPPIKSDEIVSVPPPEFVSVTDFAALVLPTLTVPNASELALIAAAAGDGVPTVAAACVTTNVWPAIVRFAERVPPALAPAA
jgi:hypothetical protein